MVKKNNSNKTNADFRQQERKANSDVMRKNANSTNIICLIVLIIGSLMIAISLIVGFVRQSLTIVGGGSVLGILIDYVSIVIRKSNFDSKAVADDSDRLDCFAFIEQGKEIAGLISDPVKKDNALNELVKTSTSIVRKINK